MQIVKRSFLTFISAALLFGALGMPAHADNQNPVNNIRETRYSPEDVNHTKPLANIVAMPIINNNKAAALAAAGPILYHGGPILQNPNIYVIWYGTWTNPCTATGSNNTNSIINDFISNVGSSPWYGINTRYYSQSGSTNTYVTPVVNNVKCVYDSGSLGTTLDSTLSNQTYSVVDRAISAGQFPVDPNGLYFVLTSKNIKVTGFLTQFCGYHGAYNPTSAPTTSVAYSFVGDASSNLAACANSTTASINNNPAADAMASVLAHELVEAVSDPQLNAWYDAAGNENGDMCAWTFGTTNTAPNGGIFNTLVGSRLYMIQQNWVPASTGCAMYLTPPTYSAVAVTPTLNLNVGLAVTNSAPVLGFAGTGPYTYSISPALPAGLTYSTTTGAISGTPSALLPATTETVTVTDSLGAIRTTNFTLQITQAFLSSVAVSAVNATLNQALASVIPVTAIGGTAPLTFTISPALPAGLTINASTGAISGTPTATLAARAETVTITDNTGAKVTGAFTLKVTALTSTVRTASVKFMQNSVVASTVPITVTGGSTPYVYSISPALPAGLTFNTTSGAITGTPTASIPATVETVTIRDSNGAQITNTFTLQVSPPITGTVLIASQTITKATAITSFTPVVGGGSAYGGFKYTATLPAGLTINVNTGAITGTAPATAAAAKNYSIKITDSANFSISKTFSLTIV